MFRVPAEYVYTRNGNNLEEIKSVMHKVIVVRCEFLYAESQFEFFKQSIFLNF
jgi:hypothetical protein